MSTITCLRLSGDEETVLPLLFGDCDSDSLRFGFLLSVDEGRLQSKLWRSSVLWYLHS